MDDSINADVGSLDIEAIENELKSTKDKKRGTYSVYTPQERFIIAKYAAENGTSKAVHCFKTKYPSLNESTVRGFKSKYEKEMKAAKLEERQPLQVICSQPRGRPTMLGKIDDMVQTYLKVKC